MQKDIKIICTIGPSTSNLQILQRLAVRDVFLIRINLSHVDIEELEDYILILKKCGIPIAIDTEGSQIRTGQTSTGNLNLKTGDRVNIHRRKINCDQKNLYFNPYNVVDYMEPGNLIAIDFNSVLLQVEDTSGLQNTQYVTCRVIIGGTLAGRKGVHCDDLKFRLPPFSVKDIRAVEIAKKFGIRHFTLSFMNNAEEIAEFKNIYYDTVVYAKIETIEGIKNVSSILALSDGILIDRGDLSREIPVEKMPLMQKVLIETANQYGKEGFIASNLLETMASDLKPSRAEASDIVNSIIDGVSGFVLTKETAVGRYPVETVNMLNALIQQGKMCLRHSKKADAYFTTSLNLMSLTNSDDFTNPDVKGALIQPHGGRLIERYLNGSEENDWETLAKLEVDEEVLMDVEQIGIGTYSPLEGFLSREDFQSVLDHMRLKNGTPWPLPICLAINEEDQKRLLKEERIALVSKEDGEIYGLIEIDDIFSYNKSEFAAKVFGTEDQKHPGVTQLKKSGNYLIGGKVQLRRRIHGAFQKYNLTPRQTRKIFSALGWSMVVGFHTRNVIHRLHEFIQMEALARTGCDGLFVHPVIGKKKKGDFSADIIIRSYEIMIEKYYPRNRVLLGLFSTYSRYGGPREAIFTALCRQNFGCSHFIVGRDHTGVKDFYSPTASQQIFSHFKDMSITPVFFDEIGYSPDIKQYVDVIKETGRNNFVKISGAEIRNMLKKRTYPPEWFIRPEISKVIIDKMSNGEEVFI